MRLLRSSDVRHTSSDVVFRQAWRRSALASGVMLAAAAAMITWAARFRGPWVIAIVGSGLLGLMSLLAITAVRRARRPSNWLMAWNGDRALIKLRSYLSDDETAEPDVLELLVMDLVALRTVQLTTVSQRVDENTRSSSLELHTRPDLSLEPLREALRRERTRPARSGIRFVDQPVAVVGNGRICLDWFSASSQITPSLDEAVQLLGRRLEVLPAKSRTFDFSKVGKTESREEATELLRLMADRGRTIQARKIGMRVLGWSAEEARRFNNPTSEQSGSVETPRSEARVLSELLSG